MMAKHPLDAGICVPLIRHLPEPLYAGLLQVAARLRVRIYAAGGLVRDILLGREPRDFDLVVDKDPFACARLLASILQSTLVILDEEEQAVRIAWQGQVDFSAFRKQAGSIVEDLRWRDFTINAMAVLLMDGTEEPDECTAVIDPTGGLWDLAEKSIRTCSESAFDDDPLRLLRAFRFMAVFDFSIEEATRRQIVAEKKLLGRSAPERLKYEFDLMLTSARSAPAIRDLVATGLFFELFPVARNLDGCRQPASHHLDVMQHSVLALEELEKLFSSYLPYFAENTAMTEYIGEARNRLLLKWAILFHDIGKPSSGGMVNGRITFHNHDRIGSRLFEGVAQSLRWSKSDTRKVCLLIAGHMWPFHLNNVFRKGGVTKRACLRLAKKFGEDLPGLFLLAMADSLAGRGPEKPAGLEQSLTELYETVQRIIADSLQPGFDSPPYIDGHDLIDLFHLPPGPLFGTILSKVRDAQICGEIGSREEALLLVEKLAGEKGFMG